MKKYNWFGWLTLLAALLLACMCSALAQDSAVLPEALTVIEDSAFEGDAEIRSVVLPDGVQSIGSRAFANSGLNEINLPPSLTTIGAEAFAGCGHLEVHTLTVDGLMLLVQMAQAGYDVAWADEVFTEAQTTYVLSAAAGQTIRRAFAAPLGGSYTFSVSGDESVSLSCFDINGNVLKENAGACTVDMRTDDGVYIECRFDDPSYSGVFSLDVTCIDKPMLQVAYEPQLWVYKDDQPLRNADMNGSLTQLAVGEVLTPVLTVHNTGSYRVAAQVTATLDGETVDLGFFALDALEDGMVPLPAARAFAAETAGSHSIDYTVTFEGSEKVASMTWDIADERPAAPQAVAVKAGSNTVELSQADGNLFLFNPTRNGVYQIYTSNENYNTYGALRDGRTGELIVSDDDNGTPYQNFVFSRALKAGTPVYIDVGMKNYKGATDVTLGITYCGTPSLKYASSLYVFDDFSWYYADDGDLTGSGMIKLKDKGDLSTLAINEYLTPVLVITNSSSKAMPLGLTAVLDGDVIPWSTGCTVPARGKFVAYLYSMCARRYETPGTHTIEYYINGNLATSYTWEVAGNRAPHIFDGTPMLHMGENYRHLDDDDGSFDWFRAPCAGIYRFSAQDCFNDASGMLFDADMNLLAYDDPADSKDYAIYQYLQAGQIVYLHSMLFDDTSSTESIFVELVSTEPAPAAQLSIGTISAPMAANDIFTYSFTAPYAGEFVFLGVQGYYNGSIRGALYDTCWQDKELTGTGYNGYYSLRCRLEKGETVYLKTTCTKADPSASIKVSFYGS